MGVPSSPSRAQMPATMKASRLRRARAGAAVGRVRCHYLPCMQGRYSRSLGQITKGCDRHGIASCHWRALAVDGVPTPELACASAWILSACVQEPCRLMQAARVKVCWQAEGGLFLSCWRWRADRNTLLLSGPGQ